MKKTLDLITFLNSSSEQGRFRRAKEIDLSRCRSSGDPLQRLPEAAAVHDRCAALRRLVSDHRPCRSGELAAPQWHHGDQAPQQHVHVPGQSGSQAHLPRLQVWTGALVAKRRGEVAVCRGVPEPHTKPCLLPRSWLLLCMVDTAVSV